MTTLQVKTCIEQVLTSFTEDVLHVRLWIHPMLNEVQQDATILFRCNQIWTDTHSFLFFFLHSFLHFNFPCIPSMKFLRLVSEIRDTTLRSLCFRILQNETNDASHYAIFPSFLLFYPFWVQISSPATCSQTHSVYVFPLCKRLPNSIRGDKIF
jgi:hypothetical protein